MTNEQTPESPHKDDKSFNQLTSHQSGLVKQTETKVMWCPTPERGRVKTKGSALSC